MFFPLKERIFFSTLSIKLYFWRYKANIFFIILHHQVLGNQHYLYNFFFICLTWNFVLIKFRLRIFICEKKHEMKLNGISRKHPWFSKFLGSVLLMKVNPEMCFFDVIKTVWTDFFIRYSVNVLQKTSPQADNFK